MNFAQMLLTPIKPQVLRNRLPPDPEEPVKQRPDYRRNEELRAQFRLVMRGNRLTCGQIAERVGRTNKFVHAHLVRMENGSVVRRDGITRNTGGTKPADIWVWIAD